ncbi:MAG: hypothetical protein U0470_12125 [Anaerolineae bacterium]
MRTTGESGVYLQYALVTARHPLAGEAEIGCAPGASAFPDLADADRATVLRMLQWPRTLDEGRRSPLGAAGNGCAFELATAFSAFYDSLTRSSRRRTPP